MGAKYFYLSVKNICQDKELGRVGLWRRLSAEELMLLNYGVGGVSWTARRSNQSTLKEISPEYSLEGLMLKLKLEYLGHLMCRTDSLEKTDSGKDWRQEETGTPENKMVGWHHQLDGHEFKQAPEDGDGQGSLVCCSPRGLKVRHNLATEQQQRQVTSLSSRSPYL